MDDLELPIAALPSTLAAWFETQSAIVVTIERLDEARVVVRPLLGVEPDVIARAQVSLAKYHEALMNLT